MGQQRCTASAAFDLLRQASQHRNRKLRDVAADVITNVTGRPPEPPNDFTVFPATA
jgi:AmiR/NasT family two-component response regulator